MERKILIIVIVLIITLVGIFFFNYNFESEKKDDETLKSISEFFLNNDRKLNSVPLTEKMFHELIVPVDYVLFYFPNECPSYKEDILLFEKTKDGEKYYLPEQYSLIKLPKNNYDWTKKFNSPFLFKENVSTSL